MIPGAESTIHGARKRSWRAGKTGPAHRTPNETDPQGRGTTPGFNVYSERRGGDLNPRRTQKPETIFETAAFDRSATSPPEKIARGRLSTATGNSAGPLRSRAERCPSGRRSATGNRVSGISRFEGSNPFLSAERAGTAGNLVATRFPASAIAAAGSAS